MTRDEALKKMQAVKSYMTSGNPIWSVTEIGEAFDMAIEALEQPERKKGKWIYYDVENDKYDDVRCSECGKTFTVDAERWCDIGFTASDLKFCPNCGCEMYQEGEDHG